MRKAFQDFSFRVWGFIQKHHPESGQTAAEYALIVGVMIALVVVVILIQFREDIITSLRNASDALRSSR